MQSNGLSTELRALAARLLNQAAPDGRLAINPGAWALGEWVFTPPRGRRQSAVYAGPSDGPAY